MDKIIQAEKMSASTNIHLSYLKYLYSTAEVISSEPDWEGCFNIAMQEGDNVEDHLDVILNTAAGKLFHSNTIAIKMAKMPNAVFIKTN